MWQYIEPFVIILLNQESPISKKEAAVLVSPYLPWWEFKDEHLVQLWAAAASAIPYTDEIGQSVVDTLLHIASNSNLQPHIPGGMWSWLNRPPSLPPVCVGRAMGSVPNVFQAVHSLRDTETLKSYLLLVWSEWDCLSSHWVSRLRSPGFLSPWWEPASKKDLSEMCTLIREGFGGAGMGHHREDLLQKLDHVLGQLGLGLDNLQQHKPSLNEGKIQQMKEQYREIREVLLEVNRESN